MPKLIVLYPPPSDVATFERRIQSEHAPMVVEKISWLKKFLAAQVLERRRGRLPINASQSCISTQWNRLQAAMASPGGQNHGRPCDERSRPAARRSS